MKFKIDTLGCKVNTYESNVMSDLLKNAGYEEACKDEVCDIVIINTCTVTNTADHKSGKVIRQAVRNNPKAIIVVCGCYPQVSLDQVKEIEGISIILGNRYKSQIVSLIQEYQKTKETIIKVEDISHTSFETMRLNNFDRTRAFVKIEDGCENFCSYCIIPYSRGNVRSKNPDEVLKEIETLIQAGHSEIVLTGIHTGHYGTELDGYHFYDLLRDILQMNGLERLRISSIELNEITDDIIELMRENDILVDHMHIPLQAGSDKILKRMNRKYDLTYFKKRISKIREVRPQISITTDVIVGFPGETEEDFETTINTVRELQFSKIHVFPYSERRGTVSEAMDGKLSESEKKDRSRKLVAVSKELEIAYMERFIGAETSFLPEVWKDGILIGHTGNYLMVHAEGDCSFLHRSIPVMITGIHYPYVEAEICKECVR